MGPKKLFPKKMGGGGRGANPRPGRLHGSFRKGWVGFTTQVTAARGQLQGEAGAGGQGFFGVCPPGCGGSVQAPPRPWHRATGVGGPGRFVRRRGVESGKNLPLDPPSR